jgi:uncharacterized protein (DUF433 family)
MQKALVSVSKEVMGGTPVFTGTRVPVQTLFDFLVAGDSIDDFLEGFPTVSREQVVEFLQQAEKQMEKIAA